MVLHITLVAALDLPANTGGQKITNNIKMGQIRIFYICLSHLLCATVKKVLVENGKDRGKQVFNGVI